MSDHNFENFIIEEDTYIVHFNSNLRKNPLRNNYYSDTGTYTTINLDHTFVTGLSGGSQIPQVPQIAQIPQIPAIDYAQLPETTQAPYWTQPQTTPRRPVIVQTRPPTQPPQAVLSFRIDNKLECGISAEPRRIATGLVLNGNTANRGQFPWWENI